MISVYGVLQSLAFVVVVLLLLLRAIAYYLKGYQGKLLYYPDTPVSSRVVVPVPSDYDLPFQWLDVKTSDGIKLKSFFIYPKGTELEDAIDRPTIIHFHGNAGNIGHRIPLAKLYVKYLHVNVVLAEYRDYGASSNSGNICEEGLMLDAEATLEQVRNLPYINNNSLIIHGASLGGAVCVSLAASHERKVSAVIIENSFTSISDMSDVLLGSILGANHQITPYKVKFLSALYSFLKPIVLMIHWRSVDRISKIKVPMLFVSGSEDELVPTTHMKMLYDLAKTSKKVLACIPGGTHNETFLKPETITAMRDFLAEHVLEHPQVSGHANSDTHIPMAQPNLPSGANSMTQHIKQSVLNRSYQRQVDDSNDEDV
eukprot:TRINITY_DN18916_c0_g1_i1.p1 TRINITY_DN18916_c0_g1~~TRINITY_DN18916_c0_g1_i1.p1  ORF type:complete len:371 (+),score=66.07 TRINITY_DN18916_c0_g1_i1:84-1196(+)